MIKTGKAIRSRPRSGRDRILKASAFPSTPIESCRDPRLHLYRGVHDSHLRREDRRGRQTVPAKNTRSLRSDRIRVRQSIYSKGPNDQRTQIFFDLGQNGWIAQTLHMHGRTAADSYTGAPRTRGRSDSDIKCGTYTDVLHSCRKTLGSVTQKRVKTGVGMTMRSQDRPGIRRRMQRIRKPSRMGLIRT